MGIKMTPVGELSCAALDAGAVDFNFGEGYGETWETIYPDVRKLDLGKLKGVLEDKGKDLPDPNPWEMDAGQLAELLGEIGLEADEGEKGDKEALLKAVISAYDDGDVDAEEKFSAWRDALEEAIQDDPDAYTPMMNYYYPLPGYRGDPSEDQQKLDDAGLAVVLVTVNDETVMALAGGGMNLGEDICLGYMVLGYLPPLKFSDPGNFYRSRNPEVREWLLAACIEGAKWVERNAKYRRQRLAEFRKDWRKKLKEKKAAAE
jgi:hypothetical protein